eukprot:scaffold71979_cov17-Tisochrysis_lutea.AAC.3
MKQGHQLLAIKMEASLCPLSTESRAIQEAAALQHCLSLPSLLCKLARLNWLEVSSAMIIQVLAPLATSRF